MPLLNCICNFGAFMDYSVASPLVLYILLIVQWSSIPAFFFPLGYIYNLEKVVSDWLFWFWTWQWECITMSDHNWGCLNFSLNFQQAHNLMCLGMHLMLPVLDSFEVDWVHMEKKYSDRALNMFKAMYVSLFYYVFCFRKNHDSVEQTDHGW